MNLSPDERERILHTYKDLRVCDVRDGLDTMILHHLGSMAPSIRPLFRTRAFGIARTARYVPYAGPIPTMTPEEYWEWVGWYYQNVCPYPWIGDITPGDFIIIDQSGVDVGLMGSENTLLCRRLGVVGFVTNGGVRDTDEVILQKVPFWSAFISQGMVQGRLQYDSKDTPVSVGGVLVNPGDVVVADGDGVVVVPAELGHDVAEHAHAEHRRDKAIRRKHYEALGMQLDDTLIDTESSTS